MNFRYQLQKVVDLKNTERTQAEWMLSHALGELQMEEETLAQLLKEKAALKESLMQASASSAKIAELLQYQSYISFVERQIETKDEDVKAAQEHVSSQQSYLSEKLKDEKIWDKAREKAYEQYKTVSLKEEQEQVDELAIMKYVATQN